MPVIAETLDAQTPDDARSTIRDGIIVAVPREVADGPTRVLIRRGVRGLQLVTLLTSSLLADLLIGAARSPCSRPRR